ncbi:mitochondrial ATP synthase g subunit-domain-containing protein [Geopyxis carbonaria]|nr:mitochondrial ATP synthase g subunit-domain-containing protein [Geopyxis carbonaria]
MRSSLLRLSRQQFSGTSRRYASSTSQATSQAQAQATAAASKAKETAAQASKKAMVFLGKSGETLTRLAATTGGRTGQLLKAVEAAVPPTLYYSKVAIELSKIVFRQQKMTPPDMAVFQSTLKSLMNPQYLLQVSRNAIASVRTASRQELATVGVITAEIIGFFTVGEIIGRRKLVGYRGKTAHH